MLKIILKHVVRAVIDQLSFYKLFKYIRIFEYVNIDIKYFFTFHKNAYILYLFFDQI